MGDAAEALALAHLQRRACGWWSAIIGSRAGPRARGGEIDLILRDRDGTLVFVEVRSPRQHGHGGAAASVGAAKQRRIVLAAQHYLMRLPVPPPCRFDVVALDGDASNGCRAPSTRLTPVREPRRGACHIIDPHARTTHPAAVLRSADLQYQTAEALAGRSPRP
jgi:putative endonuclease